MKTFVNNCPRCASNRVTFDIYGSLEIGEKYNWQLTREIFCACRHCGRCTIFAISNNINTNYSAINRGFERYDGDITKMFNCEGYVSLKDANTAAPPEHLPVEIRNVFEEGAKCVATSCWNAAGTMFRMALDLATRPLLPPEGTPGINRRQRRDLGMRLPWLFDNGKLLEPMMDLSSCIHQDGNDGAHQGNLTKSDAEDLLKFTDALLTRLFTEPAKLQIAAARREARRRNDEN